MSQIEIWFHLEIIKNIFSTHHHGSDLTIVHHFGYLVCIISSNAKINRQSKVFEGYTSESVITATCMALSHGSLIVIICYFLSISTSTVSTKSFEHPSEGHYHQFWSSGHQHWSHTIKNADTLDRACLPGWITNADCTVWWTFHRITLQGGAPKKI